MTLFPLLDCPDEKVRSGVGAMLAQVRRRGRSSALRCEKDGWTTYQIADRELLETLREHTESWAAYTDPVQRATALAQFHDYAYRWY